MQGAPKEDLDVRALADERQRLLHENLRLREKVISLQQQGAESRARVQQLNSLVNDLVKGQRKARRSIPSESNQNEQQISYGKNLQSLLGDHSLAESSPEPGRPSGVSGTEVDLERADTIVQESVILEHVKENLKAYLAKSPLEAPSDDESLQVLFSLLCFTASEQEQLMQARQRVPMQQEVDQIIQEEIGGEHARTTPRGRDASQRFKRPGVAGSRSKSGGDRNRT